MNKKRIIFLGVLVAVMMFSFTTSIITFATGQYQFKVDGLCEYYDLYDSIEVPQGKFGNVVASDKVIFPSGKTSASNNIYLDEGGIYTIEYSALVEGEQKKESKNFTVKTPLYSTVGGNNSTAFYGVDEGDVFAGGWNSGREGILLSLAPGETFKYNDVINVYDSNPAEMAFKFAFEPHVKGASDARGMYVKFTDIYDENNHVTVWVKMNEGTHFVTYFMSKACDQPYVGREYHGSRGEMWHVQNLYGTPLYYSSGGMFSGSESGGTHSAGFWFDRSQQSLYLGSTVQPTYLSNDFDDVSRLTDPWKGFTTGEVYMELYADSYVADSLQILILDVVGQDLSIEYLEDKTGPTISVDTKNLTEEQLSKGYVGKEYPVFEATATDKYAKGMLNVEINTYFGYERGAGEYSSFGSVYTRKVNVVNGRIKTNIPGKYALVYRATDWYGNQTEKVYEINVLKDEEAPAITGATLEEYVSEINVGNLVYLPKIYGYTGGTGNLTVGYEVLYGDSNVAVKGDELNGFYFIPNEVGNYTVNVFVEDIIGNRQNVTYTIIVNESNSAKLDNRVNLPKYLLTETEYALPSLYATDTNGNKVLCDIKIIDGQGERIYSDKTSFTPDENGKATIVYYSGNNSQTYVLPVKEMKIHSGALPLYNFENYFESNGVLVTAEPNFVTISAQNDGSVEFVRELLSNNLLLYFAVDSENNNFEYVEITLTDIYDKNISVSTTLYNNESKNCKIGVNGKDINKNTSNASFENGKVICFNFKGNQAIVDETPINYTETMYGKPFVGFPSNKVYLTIALGGVSGESKIAITQINTQMLKTTISDNISPTIFVNGNYDRTLAKVGEEITVYSAIGSDVLDPNCVCGVSVTMNGEFITATDGTILNGASIDKEYKFVADKLGKYEIIYTAKDSKNTGRVRVIFVTYQFKNPSLELESELQLNWELGQITLPKAKVAEGVTAYITVTDPYGNIIFVKNNSFEAKYQGMYTIRYVAFDSEGNTTTIVREIGVK